MKHQLLVGLSFLTATFTTVTVFSQADQHAQHHHRIEAEKSVDGGIPPNGHPMPNLAGQDAFAAIKEIVAILEADPETDWSAAKVDALRQHLIDMHLVMLYAEVESEHIEGGMRYIVTGDKKTAAAIKRMLPNHAKQVSAHSQWSALTSERGVGVVLTVTSAERLDVKKIRGLGFAGFMVQGDHHRPHHLQMAKGVSIHQH